MPYLERNGPIRGAVTLRPRVRVKPPLIGPNRPIHGLPHTHTLYVQAALLISPPWLQADNRQVGLRRNSLCRPILTAFINLFLTQYQATVIVFTLDVSLCVLRMSLAVFSGVC